MLRNWFISLRRNKALVPATEPTNDLDALLGRAPVNLDTPELQRFIAGKTILITGAGGSIGSEICRQMMKFCPARVILLDRAENALFEIDRELRERWVGAEILPLVADITDETRIRRIFRSLSPQLVFHCAAHKHVPMMEANPGEAIKNNIIGTKMIADAALAYGVDAFVMISTDKAVNPTSVMGASKRVAEMYVQSLNAEVDAPRFLCVRFGNVLGSSGSVVPIFQQQIAAGGPVTVTHPEMRRYFMTIPEAAQLVMQAGALGNRGEIFVLDMGQPVRILDLATTLIERAGLEPGLDIEIRFTGTRPGEKLFESLACDDEAILPTAHEKIRVWQLPRLERAAANGMIARLNRAIDAPRDTVLGVLCDCVPEFMPDTLPTEALDHLVSFADDQASALRLLARKAAA